MDNAQQRYGTSTWDYDVRTVITPDGQEVFVTEYFDYVTGALLDVVYSD